jgi:F5/8 type C domain
MFGYSNLALNKPASQSSTDGNFVAANAVDGNLATLAVYCAITSYHSPRPHWWAVDLGNSVFVYGVNLTNRDWG